MKKAEIVELSGLLNSLYGDKFPGLNPAIAQIWLEDLAHLDMDLVRQGVRRWVRYHTHIAPSLDQLLEQVEYVRDEQARVNRTASPPGQGSMLSVLRDAAASQIANPERTAEDASYAHYMVLLTERHVGRWQSKDGVWHDKLTYAQMAKQCAAWAKAVDGTKPQLARDLMAAGMQFSRMDPVDKPQLTVVK